MSAYFIFTYDITNADGYAKYPPAVGGSVQQYGGEILAADHNNVAVEGDKRDNVVLLKFPSVEAAQKWYDSPEYQSALPHRVDNTANRAAFIATEFVMPS